MLALSMKIYVLIGDGGQEMIMAYVSKEDICMQEDKNCMPQKFQEACGDQQCAACQVISNVKEQLQGYASTNIQKMK